MASRIRENGGCTAVCARIWARIACDTPHIIKGRIVKVIRTESEEKFSAQGNHIGSEVKETITNKMIFNVLTPNGFKALT